MWRRLARSSVAAGLASVRRVDVSRQHTHVSVSRPWPNLLVASCRAFASSNASYESRVNDVKVRDVTLHELVRRPWIELRGFYGPVEMSKVRQTLPLVWKALSNDTTRSSTVAPEIVEDFYKAATCCRLHKLQRDVFSYMEIHYSQRIRFETYGQMFTNLMDARDPQRMRAIFERAMTRYDLEQGDIPPEIIYRLGISAAIALEDYEGMKTLMRDMEAKGVKPSIEIATRVMVAQAKRGDVKVVLKAAEKMSLRGEGKWHEADVNRVITSLGIAGEPDAAFDFYRRSQLRLSPKTLMKLMLVCRGNARPKHALAILANRRRFGLKMLPTQYPVLLEIIEELDIGGAPTNEMAIILKEMRENNVSFNDRVHALIARNQEHLHGTPFMLTPLASERGDGLVQFESDAQSRTKEADIPLLSELLNARKFAQAAAIVDSYAVPVNDDMNPGDGQQDAEFSDEGATIVPPWLADMAVEAYSQNQEIDKVCSLLRGFLCVRGDFKYALSRIVGLFGGKGKLRDSDMAYKAFLAMQFQELQIFRVRDALTRFKQNQDMKATMLLLRQVSGQVAEVVEDTNCMETADNHQDFMRVVEKSGALNFDPARVVRDILRVFLTSKRLDMVVEALDQLELDGIPIRSIDYENIFSTMSKATGTGRELYTAEDFMTIWEDMLRRSVPASKAALRLMIPVICEKGSVVDDDQCKRWKIAMIEGYRQAANDRHDNYVLPVASFSTLLEIAAETGTVEDVNTIHAGAVKTLGAPMNKKHHSPATLSKILGTWNAIQSKKNGN